MGPLGVRVTARERVFGGPVYLYAYDRALRGRRKRALGFRVRDATGDLLPEHVTQAKRHSTSCKMRHTQSSQPHNGQRLSVNALSRHHSRPDGGRE